MPKNLDILKQEKIKISNQLAEAVKNGDEKAVENAMLQLSDFVAGQIMEKAEELTGVTDCAILASRGIRQLTSEETKYYSNLIANAKQEGVITNITERLPETVIDSVLDDMRKSHPLLDEIDFVNTSASIKWVLNSQTSQQATWDELNTPFGTSLKGAIEIIDMTFCKETALMFCTKDMLELGPVWVDAYVRGVLSEALAVGLELAIVDGDGVKKPVGMTRNFKGSFNESTGYSRKTPVNVTSFDPVSYGSLLASLAKDRLNNPRTVTNVIMLVNPADYFTKIMPATTLLTPNGTYVGEILPYPTKIIQSVGVPEGRAVLGISTNYFMGIGTAKGGKLEYDDSYKFGEDLRTYVIRLYGNGRPKDINSFILLDISSLNATFATFRTVTDSGETV